MSKSHRASNKQKYKRATQRLNAAQNTNMTKKNKQPTKLTEEEKAEIGQKYGRGGVIKNTLKIWKDSSPLTFMAYLPIILAQVIFTVLWFISSMLMFIPATAEVGFIGTNALMFINMLMVSLGIPFIVTTLHLIYNYKNNRYYFLNAILYVLPASIIYLILDFINALVAVMLWENAGKEIAAKFELSLYTALIMVAAVTILALIAQLILLFKRSKDEPLLTRLGVKIEKKKK